MNNAINWFTPMPPARNGIADYSAMLLREMANTRECRVYCDNLATDLPAGVEVWDAAQAFRYISDDTPVLHQIGNNGGHVFVLDALRKFGGVVSLHDLSLLYLYELASARLEEILARMPGPTGALGITYARHWKDHGIKTAANYVLFDVVGEVLGLARRVIVHSDYARNKLAAVHGPAAREKIDVIPHFAPRLKSGPYGASRAALGIGADEIVILTSGFATRAKRFDWLVEALDRLALADKSFRWVHAGEERADEFDLRAAIAARPALHGRCKITGYISEIDLDTYIAAADIVVNLRFPSVGESSGTLARAFAAGRCCVVNDTAAYTEIPRDVAVHVPVFDTVPALTRALDGLMTSRALRETFGERASLFARTELSIESVAARYLASMDRAYAARPPKKGRGRAKAVQPVSSRPGREIRIGENPDIPALSALIEAQSGAFEIKLWFDSADAFAASSMAMPDLLRRSVAPHVTLTSIRFVAGAGGGVGLRVAGHSYAIVGAAVGMPA